jgi:hypothetical protein
MKNTLVQTTLSGVVGLAIGLVPVAASAVPFTIDQRNDNFSPGLFQNISFFAPIGQEFIPALNSLDVVELFTTDFGGSAGGNLFVDIHFDNIFGPVVGSSNILELPDGFSGISQFTFPETVFLNPEQRYVISVNTFEGSDFWGIGSSGGPNSTYPQGNQIITVNGVTTSRAGNDLWFREGPHQVPVPEPSTVLGLGVILGLCTLSQGRKRDIKH